MTQTELLINTAMAWFDVVAPNATKSDRATMHNDIMRAVRMGIEESKIASDKSIGESLREIENIKYN